MTTYPFIFRPGKIGSVTVKNRLLMAPMGIGALTNSDGLFSDRAIDYYEERARGGVGLILTTLCLATNRYEPWEADGIKLLPTFDHLIKTRNLKQLTERIHDHNCKIFAQLTAGWGRVYRPSLVAITGHRPFAPSETPLYWTPDKMAREMTIEEIEGLIDALAHAALVAREGGFDGIELHGHEGYLLDQFKTALWNRRKDSYGGDFWGRMKFPLSVIRKIRQTVGSDFPIVYRYGLEHRIEGGREREEGLKIAEVLEGEGIAALHVDVGCYENWYWPHPPEYQEPGCMVEVARAVKKKVRIPVITVGRFGYPQLVNQVLENGDADFVAIGRTLLADPEFVKKCRTGREEDIRPCVGCHECFRRIYQSRYLSCAVNPACGDERRLEVRKTDAPRKIMVIGGGMAGLEAARIAAMRGHRVTLFEKSASLGGLLKAVGKHRLKKDYERLLRFQIRQVRKENVKIRLNRAVTVETVKRENPDVVLLATGSAPLQIFQTPVGGSVKCLTALEVLEKGLEIGPSAVIVGGGATGCELAYELADPSRSITLCEQLPELAPELFHANRDMIIDGLRRRNVRILTNCKLETIAVDGVVLKSSDGSNSFLKTDTVIVSVGMKSENGLLGELAGVVDEVYAIGDCVSPRKVKDAVWDAYKTAASL